MDTNLVTADWLIANPQSTLKIGDAIPIETPPVSEVQTTETNPQVENVTPPTMIDYVVVKGPIKNQAEEQFLTGNAVQFEEGDALAATYLEEGLIVLEAKYVASAPTSPGIVGAVEPRKQYRGSVIVHEYERVVGSQKFKHIRTVEGHEYDLTEIEYKTEVRIYD